MITPDSESLVVACAADDKYSMQLAVTMRSVIANLKSYQNLKLFMIDGGIKRSNKQKIHKSLQSKEIDVEVFWLEPSDTVLKNVKVRGHITMATYYRLFVAEMLPTQYKKAIYLDTDLVVNGDIGRLWDIDMEDSHLLAVQDIVIPHVSSPKGLPNYEELGIPAESKYFNAGVLVINLEKWRIDKIGKKAIEYVEQNIETIRWWDQDGLNATLAGKWRELDPRWNQMSGIHEYSSWKDSQFPQDIYEELIHNPYVIHFNGCFKPWLPNCEHPSQTLFFQYLDLTAWSGWRILSPRIRRLRRNVSRFKWRVMNLFNGFYPTPGT